MERYKKCTQLQKQILDRLYNYLGFNEVATFDEYVEFVFSNARTYVDFESILNYMLKHIVMSFWKAYPQYTNSYIQYFWLKTDHMLEHMNVGSDAEYDPKGLIRLFVKSNFKQLVTTKA